MLLGRIVRTGEGYKGKDKLRIGFRDKVFINVVCLSNFSCIIKIRSLLLLLYKCLNQYYYVKRKCKICMECSVRVPTFTVKHVNIKQSKQ